MKPSELSAGVTALAPVADGQQAQTNTRNLLQSKPVADLDGDGREEGGEEGEKKAFSHPPRHKHKKK
jgi:hypothetical protein